jgi:hypothetical protein
MAEIRNEIGISPLCALCMGQGSSRFFFVIPSGHNANVLTKKMSSLESSSWSPFVKYFPA